MSNPSKTTNLTGVPAAAAFIFLVCGVITGGNGLCAFPSALRGAWIRGRDSARLIFTDTTVTGLGIKYVEDNLEPMTCDSNSGNTFVIAGRDFKDSFRNRRYYVCWELLRVTDSAYIFYELSNKAVGSAYKGKLGYAHDLSAPFTVNLACNKDKRVELFTTLIKAGALETDVATRCPSQFFGVFEHSSCPGVELDFCNNRRLANFSLCSLKVLNSADNVLSCMGSVTKATGTYVNFFDDGLGVTCYRIISNMNGVIMGEFYTADCTTSGNGSTPLILKLHTPCSTDSELSVVVIIGVAAGVFLFITVLVTCIIIRKKKRTGKVMCGPFHQS